MSSLNDSSEISKELETLTNEARKYSSAEEFKKKRGRAIELYTGRPSEIDEAMVEIIEKAGIGGLAYGRRLPGRIIELDSRETPEDRQFTFMHEVGHSVYDYNLERRKIRKKWDEIAKDEYDKLPSFSKEWGGKFAITNKSEEDFAEAYAVWFTVEREDRASWIDLPDSYKEFFVKYFGEHKIYHYPKDLKSFWENAQKGSSKPSTKYLV